MQTETAIGHAMKKAGVVDTLDYELRMIAAEAMATHKNNLHRALVTFRRLLVDDGRPGLLELALRPYLENFTGHAGAEIHHNVARDDADGEGRVNADIHPSVAPPVREPSAAQRKANIAAAKQVAVTILDTFKVRDGRAIGDVTFGELGGLKSANIIEATVLGFVAHKYGGGADRDAKVRDLVKVEEMAQWRKLAAQLADVT